MRAAVLDAYSEPLAVREVPDPEPGPGETLVRVRAAGLCGTDLKLVSGALSSKLEDAELPLIPGHEVAGELVETTRGGRVACSIYQTCRRCRHCLSGRETLCRERVRLGLERDGGLAEYVTVRTDNLLPFSPELDFGLAAVSMDAVAVPWRALHIRAEISPGERLVIAGAGGLGLHAIQIARCANCPVAVLDPADDHRLLAVELGAELAVDPTDLDSLLEWSRAGVDVGLETSGTRIGFDAVARAVRPGGLVVLCGYYPGLEYGLDSARLVLDELQLLGSVGADIESSRAALAAVERGEIRPVVGAREPLDSVNSALGRLASGEVTGRIVIEV